jgi:hypothetical protein
MFFFNESTALFASYAFALCGAKQFEKTVHLHFALLFTKAMPRQSYLPRRSLGKAICEAVRSAGGSASPPGSGLGFASGGSAPLPNLGTALHFA